MPLKFLAGIIATVAAGAIAWGLTTTRVADQGKRIDSLETGQRANQEMLIRIDERTGEIKRQLERRNP